MCIYKPPDKRGEVPGRLCVCVTWICSGCFYTHINKVCVERGGLRLRAESVGKAIQAKAFTKEILL